MSKRMQDKLISSSGFMLDFGEEMPHRGWHESVHLLEEESEGREDGAQELKNNSVIHLAHMIISSGYW